MSQLKFFINIFIKAFKIKLYIFSLNMHFQDACQTNIYDLLLYKKDMFKLI